MKLRQLGLLSFFISISISAWAEEAKPPENKFQILPKDVYFQPGGGLRVRYENLRDATGKGFPENEDESQASHRAQIDLRLYKGEYIETFFRLINFAIWGGANGDSSGGQHDGFSGTNGLLVNQAWGLWKVADSWGIRFGRAPLHLGLGFTYGNNDWFNVPYSFDMIEVKGDWDSLELALIAAKVQEFSTVPNQTLSSDPEENHIIISLDIKDLADSVDTFNFNFVQINRDLGSPDGGTSILNGLNMQRISLETGITGTHLFGHAFFSYIAGEEKVAPANRVNSVEKVELSQTAMDIKLGYGFPESNNLKFWGGYHFDSGDRGNSDNENGTFDSFFYEVYGQSGLMDLIRWGNLSFYRIGMDLDVFEGLTIGGEWLSMQRTEASDGIQFGDAGRFYKSRIDSQTNDLILGSSKDIGKEFDIWVDRKFQSGVNVRLTWASFFPGEAFSGAVANSGRTPDSHIYQILTQVGYFF